VTVFEARVVQVLPLRRCKKTVPVNEAPFDVSWPVIEKGLLTGAEEGAEMVRTVGVFASTAGVALQNNNAQITSTAATTITPLFSPNIPTYLGR
jgi:hypothetical protein